MKKYMPILLAFTITGCSLTGPLSTQNQPTSMPTNSQTNPTTIISNAPTSPSSLDSNSESNQTIVSLSTKDGDILLKLYSDESPSTVKNFLSKANSGFYKNLTFHRVEPGFVVQGGDPLGNGTGGGNQKSEINNIPFKRGSLGLARANNIEISNDSQFFVCLATETCKHLTNQYVNFGEVISGMDVVDKIRQGDKILDLSVNTK
jgi:cyclophilin family peptidyl-prolyl cis-trans isomerase